MTRLLDVSAGRIQVKRPNGSIVLDTAERMPAKLGEMNLTGVTLEWPVTDGEYNEFLPLNGLYRHRMFQTQQNDPVVLGAYPAGMPSPQFYWCRYRLAQSVTGNIGGIPCAPGSARDVWQPLVGSALIETFNVYLMRHVNLAVIGSNLVIERRQSTVAKTTDFDVPSSTRSVLSLDIKVAWGIFDA